MLETWRGVLLHCSRSFLINHRIVVVVVVVVVVRFCLLYQKSLFGALTGGSGVKIDIKLVPHQGQEQGIIPMDHYPSWKLHKNPFWRVKHPNNAAKLAAVAPVMSATGQVEVKPQMFAYEASQDIGGVVTLNLAPGKKLEHLGIKVQFIGRIDMVSKRS